MPESRSEHTSPAVAAIRLMAIVMLVLLVIAWGFMLHDGFRDPERFRRDWTAFHRAGQLFIAGELDQIYPDSFNTKLPFLYPPYALYGLAPIGLLQGNWPHLVFVLFAVVCSGASLFLLRKTLSIGSTDFDTIVLVFASFAPLHASLVVGQTSGLLLLLTTLILWAWMRRHSFMAGAAISLLSFKPHIAAILGLGAAFQRNPRIMISAALCLALLICATVPMGAAIWQDYLSASSRMSDYLSSGHLKAWKHVTVFATIQELVSPAEHRSLHNTMWAISFVILTGVVAWNWRGTVEPEDLPRRFSLLVLLLVGGAPYMYFYDALLLTIPAIVWYTHRHRYCSSGYSAICGIMILCIYLYQHLSLWIMKEQTFSLLGPMIVVWLLAEAADQRLARRKAINRARSHLQNVDQTTRETLAHTGLGMS